ncbi:hypothetical protein HJC23_003104 [Cyclotella cryptica]|uniref:BHLH domain-containing protein n=1 Tax=Cyclotella cryptica TaxID=29204 RepID=A0ABD3P4P1_9STRA
MNPSSRNNSPRAGAAQTASIGDQDMMTFLPNTSPTTDNVSNGAAEMGGGASAGRQPGSSALDAMDGHLITASGVPDPLMRFFARMTDDEAFDVASLDDLLTSVQTSPREQEGEVSDLTATDALSSLGESNGKHEQQQQQHQDNPRKREEGALHHHHHHHHHKSNHQNIDSSDAPLHVPQGNQLNYSSQGMVQLPSNVRFQPSHPISVSTSAAYSMPPLMGMDYSNVVNGGGGSMCFANEGIAQQQPQQQLPFAMMPQQQQSLSLGNLIGNNVASLSNSITSQHQVSALPQSTTSTFQAANYGHQQQQHTVNQSPWDVAASSLGFSSTATSTTASLTVPPQAPMPKFNDQQSSIYHTALKNCANVASSSTTKSNKRKNAPPSTSTTFSSANPPISEDESERKKRRSERNLREQERSHRITDCISELRTLLAEAGVHFKPDRYSTLVGVVNYIKMLQSRSKTLDEEHRRLINTISTADRLANGGGTTTVQTHNDGLGENTSRSSTDSNTDEEFLVFVQGIDYKFIFASCALALAVASVDGRFVDCNDEFLRVTEYSRAELLGEENSTEEGGHSSNNGEVGGVKSPAIGGLVTVSTCTSANSSELTTAAAAAAAPAKSPSPDLHTSFTSRPPTEVRMRKKPHLSLFNLLGREDMEAVYAAMSRMLKAPANSEHNEVSSSSHDASNSSSERTSGKEISSKEYPASSLGRGESSSIPRSSSSDSMLGSTTSSSGNEVSGGGVSMYTVDHWSGMVKHTRRKEQMVRWPCVSIH